MTGRICIGFLALTLTFSACSDGQVEDTNRGFEMVAFSDEEPSGQPRLFASPDGMVMSWVRTSETGAELRYARYRDGSWDTPRTAAAGDDWFVNWADTPGVVPLADGRLLGFYLQRTGASPYAYGIRVVIGEDDGWSEPLIPHRGRFPTEYGFVSALPQADGSARLFWLDGTEMYDPEADGGHGHGGGGAMTLRSAVLDPDGQITEEHLLDDRTCECCPTAAAQTSNGALVAYRDRSEAEVRDIAVVHLTDDGPSDPAIPAPDGWTIAGCPVNGPAVAAQGDRVAMAWFTGADGGQVRLTLSDDGGLTFPRTLSIDDGSPSGRTAIDFTDDGSVLVGWLEAGELRIRRVDPDGATQAAVAVASVPPDRATGMPQLAVHDGYVWASWVDVDARSVRLARAPVGDIP